MIEYSTSERENKLPKKIFVDVGSRILPVIQNNPNREYKGNNFYIGVDLQERSQIADMQLLGQRELIHGKENLEFRKATADRLPFDDNEVDEVYLGNLLTDPTMPKNNPSAIIREGKRVLKENGTLIINEGVGPYDLEELRNLLEKEGLHIEKIIQRSDSEEEWNKELSLYLGDMQYKVFYDSKAYFIYAKKKLTNYT